MPVCLLPCTDLPSVPPASTPPTNATNVPQSCGKLSTLDIALAAVAAAALVALLAAGVVIFRQRRQLLHSKAPSAVPTDAEYAVAPCNMSGLFTNFHAQGTSAGGHHGAPLPYDVATHPKDTVAWAAKI